uniref:Uncharacterized protein n=1 Tax=Timema tahoe TaxID=61484 RepID=A0A7R9FHT3_9NEOP|nr:unnamed protein product [Timema tahoe]
MSTCKRLNKSTGCQNKSHLVVKNLFSADAASSPLAAGVSKNHNQVEDSAVDPEWTLLYYLRNKCILPSIC